MIEASTLLTFTIALLGIVAIVSGTAMNLCTAALGGRASEWLVAKPRFFQRFQQCAGAALAALGLKFALARE